MEKSQQAVENDHATQEEVEVPMELHTIQEPRLISKTAISNVCCTHQRLIDDVLTKGGKRTGKVRCLECGTTFDDPYQGSK